MQRMFKQAVFSASLLVLSCSNDVTDEQAIDTIEQALDFDAGEIQGTISWNGEAIGGLAAQGMLVWTTTATSDWTGSTYVEEDGSFLLSPMTPNTYNVYIDQNGCGTPAKQLGSTTATVVAGSVVSANVDITARAGRVVGIVTVNGTPARYPRITIDSLCGTWDGDADGNLDHFLPPGAYTATVQVGPGHVGTFDFSVIAGETIDVGTLAFSPGGIEGTVSWNGEAVSGVAAKGLFAWTTTASSNWAGHTYLEDEGRFTLAPMVANTYNVNIEQNSCWQAAGLLGSTTVTVGAGSVATADIDITATAGRVVGMITVNGAPAWYPMITIDGLCGNWGNDEAGNFAHFLPPGDYTAAIRVGTGRLGTFDLTVLAGQTTDVGTLEFSQGDIEGTVSWNGEAVSGLAAKGLFAWTTTATSNWAGSTYLDDAGHFRLSPMTPDTYNVNIEQNGCGQAAGQLGSTAVTVVAGSVATADVDITATAGRVIGMITVNGTPAWYPEIAVDGLCRSWGGDSAGNFAHFVPPRDYTATVYVGPSRLGTFDFSIVAGQTTDIDMGTTLVGADVEIDLSGGIDTVGGLSLVFSEVVSSGQTTVVESGAGPPPDTGFRIVGLSGQPRYWDINTTAGYVPPITVCIHYDASEVTGSESNLRLRHDDGFGWEDITTSIDTVADIICGVATSLSPFAVFEEIDSDSDGIPDISDGCPTDAAKTDPGVCGCGTAEFDTDGDGVADCIDPCPADAADDSDGDRVCDSIDNCPRVPNTEQTDSDNDGVGDVCEASDADGDGVLDEVDTCSSTAPTSIVNTEGCSIDDLCPCEASSKNHGKYVSCVAKAANAFFLAGLILETDRAALVSEAAHSECGQR